MKIERFEDILAWQKGKELSVIIYSLLKNNRDFGFREQMQRAVISILNNIAEGFERGSNKDFAHFLFISKGSCAEVRSMIYVGTELNYFTKEEAAKACGLTMDISRLLSGLIKTL